MERSVFQWMLDCDSCQSAVWWSAVCSSECWTVTAVRSLCDGVLCVPVNVGLWQLSECCVRECCVFQWMLDSVWQLAEKSAVSLFLHATRAMNCCWLGLLAWPLTLLPLTVSRYRGLLASKAHPERGTKEDEKRQCCVTSPYWSC